MALSRIVRLTGCGLPEPLVLLCRLLALAILLSNHVMQIQTPFLPFVPGLDELPGEAVQFALRAALVIGCLGILFTKRTRLFAAIAGGAILLAVLSSRTYYGNNKTFTGLMLLLAALSAKDAKLLRWQFALVYFGAGLNKLLDADWQSGQFFEHWASVRLENPFYLWLSPKLPPLVAGKLFCWTSIVTELSIAALALIPSQSTKVIWLGGLFQCGLLLFTGDPFNLFFMAMQAGLLAFANWPAKPILVIWDGSCGFCKRTKEFVERFDADGLYDWRKLQSGAGDAYGLTRDALKRALHAVSERWVLSGYSAIRRMVLYLPLFWMLWLAAFALSPNAISRRVVVAAALLLLTPLSNPFGNAIYGWVARHRHELLSGETCDMD
ncbi:MAG: DUF393 domain-containing protein [Acidobacteria bacterium]|nr:DUF393 domain-containing protein [Acidobacteriota bacterium]